MNRFSRCYSAVAAWAVLASSASFAATTYSDSTFASANWQTFAIPTHGNPAATVSINSILTGGNPGSYMQMSVSQPAATTSYSCYVGMVSAPLTYNPAVNGAITQLQFSVDLEGLSVSGASYAQFFLEQSGSFYAINTPTMTPSGLTNWTNYSGTVNALTLESAFGYKTNGTVAGSLNLTATAPPIEFGFGVGEVSATQIANTFGIDNFSVSATSAPEPSAGILLLLGGTVLLLRRLPVGKVCRMTGLR